jgi:hypothetical protein
MFRSLVTVCSHAALRSNDRTNPPTYDFTSIWSIVSVATSSGSSRNGGNQSRFMWLRLVL